MRLLFILFTLASIGAAAQCKTYMIGVHRDTLNCTDTGNLKQGKWVMHVASLRGEPGYDEEGAFKDGKKEGVWRTFTLQGDVKAVENYKFGYKNGFCDYYDFWGLEHEESWRATNPINPYDTIMVPDLYDDTKVYLKVVKVDASTVQHGNWTYYDSQRGTIIRTEAYELGQQVDPITNKPIAKKQTPYFDTSTAKKNIVKTVPKEVTDYDRRNSGKKKVKVRDGATF